MSFPGNPIEKLYHAMISVHAGIRLGLEAIIRDLEESNAQNDLPKFLAYCTEWTYRLTIHHKVEEDFLFPLLNQKMDFSGEKDAHGVIHNGIEVFEVMLREVQADPLKFNPNRMRDQLLTFKEPLLNHLDNEVEHLKPEHMRKAGISESELGATLKQMEEAVKTYGLT